MRSTFPSAPYLAAAAFQTFIAIATLIVVTFGWRRSHHYGYVALAAWAILEIFLPFSEIVSVLLAERFPPQATGPGPSWLTLYTFATMVGHLISSALLLGGLWVLVFRKSISQNPGYESN